MILVIAEKPSVAQSIAKVLGATSRKDGYMEGGNYIVSWCFGHLVELADASSLMKDKRVTDLVCATDAGREGELIFRLVYNKAGCTKPFKRLWISSLEDSAIREGFNHLRDGKEYDRLYEAALSRSKADWIVGINGTRLFTTLWWSGASRRRPLQCWWSVTGKSPRSRRRSISTSTSARAI